MAAISTRLSLKLKQERKRKYEETANNKAIVLIDLTEDDINVPVSKDSLPVKESIENCIQAKISRYFHQHPSQPLVAQDSSRQGDRISRSIKVESQDDVVEAVFKENDLRDDSQADSMMPHSRQGSPVVDNDRHAHLSDGQVSMQQQDPCNLSTSSEASIRDINNETSPSKSNNLPSSSIAEEIPQQVNDQTLQHTNSSDCQLSVEDHPSECSATTMQTISKDISIAKGDPSSMPIVTPIQNNDHIHHQQSITKAKESNEAVPEENDQHTTQKEPYLPYYLSNFNIIMQTVRNCQDDIVLFSDQDLMAVDNFYNLTGTIQ